MNRSCRFAAYLWVYLVALAGLAACDLLLLTPTPAPMPTVGANPAPPATQAPTRGGVIEVFSWWTANEEAAGLQKLIEQFQAENPGAELINAAVTGGEGLSALDRLKAQMTGGNPPDSFQASLSYDYLNTWIVPGYLEPLDEVYARQKLATVLPKGMRDFIYYQGHPWSVPVDVHRLNLIWYNEVVFRDNHIDPASLATFEGWKAAAQSLQARGITPVALGNSNHWAAAHLFEAILLGSLGPERYTELLAGNADWHAPEVKTALEHFALMMQYTNRDHQLLTWDQANQRVIDGQAAMTFMGDWVKDDYAAQQFSGYGWLPAPGTQGTFQVFSNIFGLPKNAPHPSLARRFLSVLGSKQGQEAFNQLSGSLCARTDCKYPALDAYLQAAGADWSNPETKIVPSIVHGAPGKEGWAAAFIEAVTQFMLHPDVEATQKALAQAAADHK